MNDKLIFIFAMFSIVVLIFILHFIKKDKINIKYALVWLLLFFILFLFFVIPGFLDKLTKILGFQVSSNMIFSLLIGVLVIINVVLTGIVSSQDKKIRLLIQEISLLKGTMKDDLNER